MDNQHKILSAIRNPLSIIAVFVFLIEGLATISLANTYLTESQRYWFVIFCATFPVLVLAIFFVITWFRPVNLYGPRDYADEKLFYLIMKQGKIDDEVNEIVEAGGTNEEKRGIIRSDIIRAEQLALNELQKEFHSSAMTQIHANNGGFLFDGVFSRGGKYVYVEVKYLSTGYLPPEILNSIRRFCDSVGNGPEKIVAVVTKRSLDAEEREKIENSVKSVSNNVNVRFYTL